MIIEFEKIKSHFLTSELLSYGGGGERGIKEWRRVTAVGAVATSSKTADCGVKFKREWTCCGAELEAESALLSREFRVRSSVSLLVRRKSILRIRLQFDKLPEAAVREDSLPSIDPESSKIYVLQFF